MALQSHAYPLNGYIVSIIANQTRAAPDIRLPSSNPTDCTPQSLTQSVSGRTATLTWAPTCATTHGYTLHITTVNNPAQGIIVNTEKTSRGDTSHTLTFDGDGTYYWHVAAWQGNSRSGWASSGVVIGSDPPPSCGPPTLAEPPIGATVGDSPLFRWQGVSCADKYVLRVKTVPTMDSGGEEVLNRASIRDTVFYGKPEHFPARFYGRTLYWSVVPEVAGGRWAPARAFVIDPNKPPQISFTSADGANLPPEGTPLWTNKADWTFAGTASDPEGRLADIQLLCDRCDNAGNFAGNTLSGTSWQHGRRGMLGRNVFYFVAVDDKGATAASRKLDLRIDTAPPISTASINGEASVSRWPAWYNTTPRVRISAVDGGNGQAISLVRELRTRLRGPGLDQARTWPGSDAELLLDRDGIWTIEYQALDFVGNQEPARQIVVSVDRTPPAPPAAATELNGVADGQWQRAIGAPAFRWNDGADALSGIVRTELRFITADGRLMNSLTYSGAAPLSWSPVPAGIPTGSYTLLGRTVDRAGNPSAEVSLFTFRFDRLTFRLSGAAGLASDRPVGYRQGAESLTEVPRWIVPP